jgi:hypothetical protein
VTTYLNLKTYVARDIRDASFLTFSDTEVGDMVNAAIAEVGRIAPRQFQEDITVVADTLTYTPQVATFASGNPGIELSRVEVWDISTNPDKFVARLEPASAGYVNSSDAGWRMWNGVLYLPNSVEESLTVGTHLLRIWGYCPYKPLSSDGTTTDLPTELEWAVREFAVKEAYERLSSDRALFQQWQSQPHNTDISAAALMNAVNVWTAKWDRRRRQLAVLREAP